MEAFLEHAASIARKTNTNIIVIGPYPAASTPPPGGQAPALGDAQLRATAEALQAENGTLKAQLTAAIRERDAAALAYQQANARVQEMTAAAAAHAQGNGAGGASAQLVAMSQERDALAAKVNELQGLISQLRAASQGNGAAPMTAPAAPGGDPGNPEVKFALYGIEFLGLSEDVAKKVGKLDPAPKNIGDLLNALEGGRIKNGKDAKPSFTKDEINELALKVALGRVPSSARPVTSAAPAGGATDVPAGHTDQPWAKRLESARKKEVYAVQLRADLAKAEAERARLTSGEQNPDTAEALKKLNAKMDQDDKLLGVVDGQVLAFLHALNLPVKDPKSGKHLTVDQALQAAGLVHLVQAAPAVASA